MAQPSTITNDVRGRTTRLIEALYTNDTILSVVEDTGPNDAARAAFFEEYLEDEQGEPTTDITSDEFFAAVAALRSLRTWLIANRPTLAKLRI